MSARNARNVALIGLVVVAWTFAVETAFIGAVLQKRGEPQHTIQLLMVLSVCSLLVSVLACARAVVVFRTPATQPAHRGVPSQRSTSESGARVLVG